MISLDRGSSGPLDLQVMSADEALRRVETYLAKRLTLGQCSDTPLLLYQAMQEAVIQGGKRLRPCLMLRIAHALGAHEDALLAEKVLPVAGALELIHAYSLVHDDLPAMDNAPLRRGMSSCWKAHGESTAILVGDALIPLAFEWIATADLPPLVICALINKLSVASGSRGMVGGQFMDMAPDAARIYEMQRLKTGALIGLACEAPAVILRLSESYSADLRTFGQKLGVIYQVVDDVLDHAATAEQLGKPAQHDDAKITFVTTLGLKGARAFLGTLIADLTALTASFPTSLRALLDEVVSSVLARSTPDLS